MANKDSGFVKLRGQAGLKSVDYYLVVPILSLTFIGLYVLQKVLSNGYAAYPVISTDRWRQLRQELSRRFLYAHRYSFS